MQNIKALLEHSVHIEDDFSMAQLYQAVWPSLEESAEVTTVASTLKDKLGKKNYQKLGYAILRSAFLIELVKVPKIETTKFQLRWFDQLDGDPRWCSFDECLQITFDLLKTLPAWLEDKQHDEALILSFICGLLPYEAPIDYHRRNGHVGRLHERRNIGWFFDELMLRTLKLRRYLTDPETSPDMAFFRKVLNDKIKVKTYLTDRVLTGEYKTNREKRWETHPRSVHFAERRTCMAIEYALVTQICSFEGFPKAFLAKLQHEQVLPATLPVALCPITGDALSYEAFREELLNPTHGKSDFQVGHLNPLKLGTPQSNSAGHTADNISWISADGNRIQGSLSLGDVRGLVKRIAENYRRHGW
jgi:hypothetical protein